MFEKNPPEKKHYYYSNHIPPTSIVPEPERSKPKDTREKRHYSPLVFTPTNERKSLSCKKQFGNAKSIDNLSQVIAQKCQSKKKSLSQALLSKSNRTMISNDRKNKAFDTLNLGTYQQIVTTPKTGIKIAPKYHQYDNRFLG